MLAELPAVVRSTPRPGIIGSTVLPTGAIGMRCGVVQVMPSVDVDSRRSSTPVVQRASARQFCHVTYTLPDLSMPADTRSPARRLPAGPKKISCPTKDGRLQVLPPSVDLIERTLDSKQSEMGMITVPFGCTSGWPPMTHV